jgi:hypothetical protein
LLKRVACTSRLVAHSHPLSSPAFISSGFTIVGELGCKPNEENTREVDVEIHYSVRDPSKAVPAAKKSVETRTVQLFAVR